MSIKTFHFTNAWHEQSGGIATFYRALLEAGNRQRRAVRLVVPGPTDRVEEVGTYGRIYQIAAPPAPLNSAYRILYPTHFLTSGSAIQRILEAERPDLVEICDKYCLNYLGALLRLRLMRDVSVRPVVVGLTCERMDQNLAVYLHRPVWGSRFAAVYMRHLYFPFFDHHIAISEHTAGELRKVAVGHPVERGVWINPMGVALDCFSPERRSSEGRAELIARSGANPSSFLLLYAGRLAPEKNLDVLVGMMELLAQGRQQYHLILAGDGIERQRLQAAVAARASGRVSFLGHMGDREALSRVYANSDLFVHPNPNEPFGIAPLEAMASGLPIVAPDSGGIKSYACESNAYLVSGSAESFAAAVRSAMTEAETRLQKAENALQTAQRYSWSSVTESFLQLYDSIHAVATGGVALDVAAPAFRSTAATSVQSAKVTVASQTARHLFTLYSRLASGKSGRGRALPAISHPQEETR